MKKKITSKVNLSKTTPEKKASTLLIDSMVKIAKEPDPDEEIFRLLVRTSNAKVLDALRSNKNLNRSQKSELGIVEEPVFLSKDFKKLPAATAKKELLKFFKELDEGDEEEALERFLALAPNARRTDLDFSTEECREIIRKMINFVDDSTYSDLTFTNILSWLGEKKCEVRLNTDLISGLINDSSEFVVLLDKLSKTQQMDIIDLLCKKPLNFIKYTEILALGLGDPYLLEAANGRAGLYTNIDDEVMYDRVGTSEWTTYFLKTAKLSTTDAKKLHVAMKNIDTDNMMETVLPLEAIDAALDAGIIYVRHCSNFEKWLESLFAARKKEKAATTKGSMPEQIAQWICEEDTNANKVCEVVELAASAKV